MSLNFGQLLGGAGIVASRQREAEDATLRSRQTLMQVQEINRMMEVRARMGEGGFPKVDSPYPCRTRHTHLKGVRTVACRQAEHVVGSYSSLEIQFLVYPQPERNGQ